ncbi:hypothetical protein G6O67_005721 [Ophiocordyceps sinensis]|uniref:Uncharacterized protein n=2 Tax=Ophiocordyceps sinensis TaxID=72228 RepID=A0A8H4LWU8_9HYPO|nr:hypothetical protein OCS_05129 [Ophiocordyceps sinensis CO18]KAF4507045.1 hypothetical protein G6O67_005721 [Ophiocordyceps sinensis]
MMRREEGMLTPKPKGNSESARNCARLKAALNETAELWTRPLTREEYYRRNFMWVRCRSMQAKWFDMGGAWFDRGDEALKKLLGRELVDWQFKYVRGNWGDATLFFSQFREVALEHTVAKMIKLAEKASSEYRRNFYVIDCPGQEEYAYYATERKGVVSQTRE